MDRKDIANEVLHWQTGFRSFSHITRRASMSPTAGDATQTPDSKPSGGFASVFKNLTGSRSTKSPNPQSPASIAPQVNGGSALQPAAYGGPPNYEQLYAQLKAGNPLSERIAAAESLRHAVQDYPLSSVRKIGIIGGLWLTSMAGHQHFQRREGSHRANEYTRSSNRWF